MKKLSCMILALLTAAAPLFSQDRDSLLRRINQIKLDTEHYLYGLATVPGDDDVNTSVEQAGKELKVQLDAYINEGDFPFLKEKKAVPQEVMETVSCLVRPHTYRSIVFVNKTRLQEAEKALADELGSDSRKEDLESLVQGILSAQTLNEVLDLVASHPLAAEIRAGQKIDNETQEYANDGLLVYFDKKTKKILEVMTPMDASYVRRNAKTGQPTQPMKYKNAPLWVYVEGLKNNIAL